jgi:GMP synthase-like glutamine amidotransferase
MRDTEEAIMQRDPVLIFRHHPGEGPGYLGQYLDEQSIPWREIAIDQGETVPGSLRGASGLVFMGGPMSVNDPLPWIARELVLIRKARDARLPVLGHCLGGQLIAKALGATVTRNPVKEIGWLPVRADTHAAACGWLGGLGGEFEVFHWHGETFSLPEGAQRILSSAACANQAFVMGNMLALQCHIEMTASMVLAWAREGAAEIAAAAGPTVQDAAVMSRGLDARIQALHAIARQIYSRWTRLLPAA